MRAKVVRDRITDIDTYLSHLGGDEPIVFSNLCDRVYHNKIDGYISRSSIVDYFNSKADYHAYHVAQTVKRDETAAMKLGTLVHTAVLEPHAIDQRYAIIPDSLLSGPTRSVSSGAAKDWRDDREANGLIVIKEKDLPQVQAVANAVREFCPELAAASLKKSYMTEIVVLWTCRITKLKLKLRADIVIDLDDKILCTDLKSSAYFDEHQLRTKFEGEKLVFQSNHYGYGLETVFQKPVHFNFLLVRTKGNPRCRLAKIDPNIERAARFEYMKTLSDLKSSIMNNDWTDKTDNTMAIISPREFSYMREERVDA